MERCLSEKFWAKVRQMDYFEYILCGVSPLGKRVLGVLWQNQCVGGYKKNPQA